MKKLRVFCLIISIILVLSSFNTTVHASSYSSNVFPQYHHGTMEFSDLNPSNVQPRTDIRLFSMTANALNSLLSTNNTTKYFYKSDLPTDSYIYYYGTLSSNNGHSIRAGIGYVGNNNYIYLVDDTVFPSGQNYTSDVLYTSNLNSSKKYVGFIDGANTDGAYGTVHYYYTYFN